MPYNSSTGRKETFYHAKSLVILTVRKFTTDGNDNIAQKLEAKFLEMSVVTSLNDPIKGPKGLNQNIKLKEYCVL